MGVLYNDQKKEKPINGVTTNSIDSCDTYVNIVDWKTKVQDLVSRFVKNFVKYETNESSKVLIKYVPIIK